MNSSRDLARSPNSVTSGYTAAAAAELYPVYLRERRRLLSNAACMLGCAKRFSAFSDVRGYLLARRADQRALASLRSTWMPVIRAAAKAGGK